MTLFKNTYNQAQIWKSAIEVREVKKQALQPTTEAQEMIVETNYDSSYHPQVVFTHADIGHTKEEANKIQQLYAELKKFSEVKRGSMQFG